MTEAVSQTDSFLFAFFLVYSFSFKPLPPHTLSIFSLFFGFAFLLVFYFAPIVFKSNQDLLDKEKIIIEVTARYSSLLLATVEGQQKAVFLRTSLFRSTPSVICHALFEPVS